MLYISKKNLIIKSFFKLLRFDCGFVNFHFFYRFYQDASQVLCQSWANFFISCANSNLENLLLQVGKNFVKNFDWKKLTEIYYCANSLFRTKKINKTIKLLILYLVNYYYCFKACVLNVSLLPTETYRDSELEWID